MRECSINKCFQWAGKLICCLIPALGLKLVVNHLLIEDQKCMIVLKCDVVMYIRFYKFLGSYGPCSRDSCGMPCSGYSQRFLNRLQRAQVSRW
jgi:hypothetical protein